MQKLVITIMIACMASFCSSSRIITPQQASEERAVKMYLVNGTVLEGIVVKQTSSEISVVNEADQKTYPVAVNEIRRLETSPKYYDFEANLISNAEVSRTKTNKNTWVYGFGGAAVGGLVGLAIGLPIWLANDNPPPLFVGGIGAIAGSIYFGARGIRIDRETAVQTVRYARLREQELQQAKTDEEAKLRQLKAEKELIKQRLEEKKAKDQ